MKLNNMQRTLLMASIGLWKVERQKIEQTDCFYLPNHNQYNCPCCLEWNKEDPAISDDDCNGCPIKQNTGEQYCEENPYIEYDRMCDDFQYDNINPTKVKLLRVHDDMINFMKKILKDDKI